MTNTEKIINFFNPFEKERTKKVLWQSTDQEFVIKYRLMAEEKKKKRRKREKTI